MKFRTKFKDEMSTRDLELFYDELKEISYLNNQGLGSEFDCEYIDHVNWILKKAINNRETDVVCNLMLSGVKIEVINDLDQTALHLAYHQEDFKTIDLLFSFCNNNNNYTDIFGLSHFHIACMSGNLKVVERFLNLGVKVDFQDIERKTGLHYAVKYYEYEIAELLLKRGADSNFTDSSLKTALHLNCDNSIRLNKLRYLFDKDDFDCSLDKNIANKLKQLEITKLLVNYGGDVNARDENGNTPLLCLLRKIEDFSHEQIIVDLKKIKKQQIEYLLSKNAKVQITNADGNTVLHLTVSGMSQSRHTDREIKQILKLFLRHGAKIDARNKKNETPLQLAVYSLNLEVIELLLNHGAHANDVELTHDCFFRTSDVLPRLENVRNLLIILNMLTERGMKMTEKDNIAVMKFFVNSNAELYYMMEKNTLNNLKNLLELGTDSVILKAMSKYPINICDCSFFVQMTKKVMIYEIHKYLNIMEYGEIYIDDSVLNCLKKKVISLFKYLLPAIHPNCDFDKNSMQHDLGKLDKEIQKMKETMLTKSISLHDLLKLNPQNIHSSMYESIVHKFNFSKYYPIYGGVIKGRFARAIIRRYISESAKNYFRSLIGINLPDLCCEQIFGNLSNENLLALCLASIN